MISGSTPFRPTHCSTRVDLPGSMQICVIPLPETLDALMEVPTCEVETAWHVTIVRDGLSRPFAEYRPLQDTYELIEAAPQGSFLGIVTPAELSRPVAPAAIPYFLLNDTVAWIQFEATPELQRLKRMGLRFTWMAAILQTGSFSTEESSRAAKRQSRN